MRRVAILAFLSASALGMAAVQAAKAPAQPAHIPATRVQDLHFGDVLFQTFLGEDVEALTRLEAYSHWGLMPHHRGEADLLAGGLYLQLGMHNEAGRRFETLLGPEVPGSVKARAWFYLAKVWYARGYFDRAVESLSRIEGSLPPLMQAERVHLQSNALLRLGRYDEAIAQLSAWHSSSSWSHFAKFNLGVALLRTNRLADGAKFLDEVGTLKSTSEELLSLRDKANLALGFAYLQSGDPAAATPFLERVRLDGPQSGRALLALGWADAAQQKYDEALTPWLALRERNLLDAAVQESFLAVPYAFAKLGANGQAADYYEQALQSFGGEQARIDESIVRIRDGGLLHNLLGDVEGSVPQRGWYWQLQQLPDAPESRYLFSVLAGNDFQEGLKNFRDLGYLGSTLARWDENMVVYGDMIEAREKAYAERIPRTDALLASGSLEKLTARREALEGRVNDVVNMDDVAALGTPGQRAQWQRIQDLEVALAAAPADQQAAARDKLRLIKGVLYWDLKQSFRDRLYQQRRDLRELDRSLAETNTRWLRVQQARESAPTTTGDFAARISALQSRLEALRGKLAGAADAQGKLLADIAVHELEAQKQRLGEYEQQARFALASIYDRAAEAPPSTPAAVPPPAGVQP
ncbi:MAG TPA: tetratricopeptide repeat protein [Steroidobacteraceae bacterium]|nr:tetratricopeptide repeat protein [Steroidobacteraceae bacterium]